MPSSAQPSYNLAALEPRLLLDLGVIYQLRADAGQHSHTDFLVFEFTATELHTEADLVAFIDEALGTADLDLKIVLLDIRAIFSSLVRMTFWFLRAAASFFCSS